MKKSVVLITGSSHGLGSAMAIVYAKNGHALLLTGRDEKALESCASDARRLGVAVYTFIQDLNSLQAADHLLQFIQQHDLTIDVLINNAGLGSHTKFSSLPAEDMQALLMVNIYSLVAITRLILPSMLLEKKGHIINIASVYAYISVPNQVIYAASKSFVKSFSTGLAMELANSGVSVSCVCPGSTTQTNFRKRIGLKATKNCFSAPAQLIAKKIYRGMQKKKLIIIPMWYNCFFVLMIQCVSTIWLPGIINFFVYRLRKIKTENV